MLPYLVFCQRRAPFSDYFVQLFELIILYKNKQLNVKSAADH